MKKELECLHIEEQLLLKRKEADDLRRQLAEQRHRVTRLRGKSDIFKIERRNTVGPASKRNIKGDIKLSINLETNEVDINIKTLSQSKILR